MPKPNRALPVPTPETQHFWDGTNAGEIRLQHCDSCNETYFPPRPFCPACSSREVSVFVASGKGTLESYVINNRPHPAFDGPYSIALVKLAEGPRMMSNVIGCAQTPESLQLDMALQVEFLAVNDDITLPQFRPAASSGAKS